MPLFSLDDFNNENFTKYWYLFDKFLTKRFCNSIGKGAEIFEFWWAVCVG